MEPSGKMKKFVRQIEDTLGIKFEGDKNSFDEVSKFIGDNIDAWKAKKDSSPITEKQQRGIELIKSRLGETFTGSTQGEASAFLNRYLKQAVGTFKNNKRR